MPFFSILVPSYNRPEYLPKAVASVLASGFSDFELIVSDDKSPRQAEIRTGLAHFGCDRRLVFVPQPENLGEARNRHFLMQHASGRYRIIIGDDDLLAPFALSRLHDVITRQPGYDLYLFGYAVIDKEGRVFETRRALKPIDLTLENRRVVRDLFCSDLHPFWLYHPATFCFPASLHRDIIPNHKVGIGDDLIFLFDAVLGGKRALVVPEVLFSYRKFLGPAAYRQTNLSKTLLGNVTTRRHILYNLLVRENLPPQIADFIRSRRFRERFLYDSVVTDPDMTEDMLAQLELDPEHLEELGAWWRKHSQRWYRHYLQLQRVWRYSRYFGIAGLRESFRIFRERGLYRRSVLAVGAQ